jgi:uncharacterized protein YktA (UPF0223 family)
MKNTPTFPIVMIPAWKPNYFYKQLIMWHDSTLKVAPWTDADANFKKIHTPQELYITSYDAIKENDFFIQHNDEQESFLRKAVSYKWFEKNVKAKATTQNYLHDFCTLNGYSPYPMVKKTLQEEMQDPANALKGFREKVIASTNRDITPTSWLNDEFKQEYASAYNKGAVITEVVLGTDTLVQLLSESGLKFPIAHQIDTFKILIDESAQVTKNF